MHAYESDPRYLRYYEWTHRRPEDAQAFVQRFLGQQQEQPRTKFQPPNHAGTLGIDSGDAWMLSGEGGTLLMMPPDGK